MKYLKQKEGSRKKRGAKRKVRFHILCAIQSVSMINEYLLDFTAHMKDTMDPSPGWQNFSLSRSHFYVCVCLFL
jgi:hypothetical protein